MENKSEQLEQQNLFQSPFYIADKPEFLEITRKISKKFIEKRKNETELNPNYPVYMTENINYDPEMTDFANYVAQTGWNILDSQGYAMENFTTYFSEMWCQEHHNHSAMDRHIHGGGVVLTGFYFLDCPENSSKVLFHEPKDSKIMASLPEKEPSNLTQASNIANFVPHDGQIMFTNSWLPHSFTRNESKEPMRFIHFNIAVALMSSQQSQVSSAEIV
jgi:uncharacterized protein (TIGR02466 family)